MTDESTQSPLLSAEDWIKIAENLHELIVQENNLLIEKKYSKVLEHSRRRQDLMSAFSYAYQSKMLGQISPDQWATMKTLTENIRQLLIENEKLILAHLDKLKFIHNFIVDDCRQSNSIKHYNVDNKGHIKAKTSITSTISLHYNQNL